MNALVTSVSRKVPLLEALRPALGGGVLWAADTDPEAVGRHFADRFWEMPPSDSPGIEAELAEFCSREEIGLILPSRDLELPLFASLRDELGAFVPVGSPEAVETCQDKLAFGEHCRAVGLTTPATATDLPSLDGDSIVVKERRGSGSRRLALGVDRERAARAAADMDEPIFQSPAPGVEHSVDLYVNRDGQVVDAAPRLRVRVFEGESWITETVEAPAVAAAATALAESLELRGPAVVQALVDGDDVSLIECNPRVGGASTLGFAAGVSMPEWLVREAAGETVAPQPGSYRRGLRLIRYPVDRLIEP